jgi:hypothetical protein
MKNCPYIIVAMVGLVCGCGSGGTGELVEHGERGAVDAVTQEQQNRFPHSESVVWAVNVGGSEYLGVDGVSYRADEMVLGGQVGQLDSTKGSQDGFIYQSYREGHIQIERPIENGFYDIIF